ncbi:hypothetical protein QR680_010577 [Steinernema hermaphroditum]|uniref:Ig-like domain-containing protein n=1 Tax=Steinernema hermaphroditum TaxID=289476 RepID=A0AA39IRX5_9BILA|nr:hypothetical protein QR680_010577 [Steinernema hermaphroditum]
MLFLVVISLLVYGVRGNVEVYNATAAIHSESRIIKELLKDYDHRVRPLGTDTSKPGHGPVVVMVNIYLRSISNVNEANMEYTLQLTFRQSWNDHRLAYSHMGSDIPSFFVLTEGQEIWKPDTFFLNEKQAHRHTIDKPNTLIRLFKNGDVLYSVRLTMTLSCPMNLQSYPMDVQRCHLKLASYAYTTDDIEYQWTHQNPVQLNVGLVTSLPQFTLTGHTVADCSSITNTGNYSCLQLNIELTRDYFIIHLFAPSSMLVIVSWVSFWLDVTAVPGRVTLGVTTLLTMTTKSTGVNAKLPPVSYTKAIDVWIGLCMAFLFGSLLEFALVTYLHTADNDKKKQSNSRPDVLLKDSDDDVYIPTAITDKPKKHGVLDKIAIFSGIMDRYHQDRARTVDYLSRFIFPILFLFCNVIYWWHYSKDMPTTRSL